MSTPFVDYFGKTPYSTFRPEYTQDVFETIFKYAREHGMSPPYDLVVDVGCGSGQATRTLAQHAQRVIGVDPSLGQIQQAKENIKLPNVEFIVSRAEKLDAIADHSVSLLTAATCIHWFDIPAFFAEARRVLKPGGIIAYWAYNFCIFEGKNAAKLNEAFLDFHSNKLEPYWTPTRKLVVREYQDIKPIGFKDERRASVDMRFNMSISHFTGYLNTWSAVKEYEKAHPGHDIIEEFRQKLLSIHGDNPLHVIFPVFITMATNQ